MLKMMKSCIRCKFTKDRKDFIDKYNKELKTCVVCIQKTKCKHNRHKDYCRKCKGKYICVHDKFKYDCPKCNLCKHNVFRKECKECGYKKKRKRTVKKEPELDVNYKVKYKKLLIKYKKVLEHNEHLTSINRKMKKWFSKYTTKLTDNYSLIIRKMKKLKI